MMQRIQHHMAGLTSDVCQRMCVIYSSVSCPSDALCGLGCWGK